VVVVVSFPVVLVVPGMSVFIPPAMVVFPAIRARSSQLRAPVFRFRTLRSVLSNRFVKIMIGFNRTLLTIILRAYYSCTCEHEGSGNNDGSQYETSSHESSPTHFPLDLQQRLANQNPVDAALSKLQKEEGHAEYHNALIDRKVVTVSFRTKKIQ
jgi:hypothetical protein